MKHKIKKIITIGLLFNILFFHSISVSYPTTPLNNFQIEEKFPT